MLWVLIVSLFSSLLFLLLFLIFLDHSNPRDIMLLEILFQIKKFFIFIFILPFLLFAVVVIKLGHFIKIKYNSLFLLSNYRCSVNLLTLAIGNHNLNIPFYFIHIIQTKIKLLHLRDQLLPVGKEDNFIISFDQFNFVFGHFDDWRWIVEIIDVWLKIIEK